MNGFRVSVRQSRWSHDSNAYLSAAVHCLRKWYLSATSTRSSVSWNAGSPFALAVARCAALPLVGGGGGGGSVLPWAVEKLAPRWRSSTFGISEAFRLAWTVLMVSAFSEIQS